MARELLLEMEHNLTLLSELRLISKNEFLANPRHYLLAERCFQLAIQCLVDIGFYLASQRGWQRPEDSRDAILTMGNQGVLKPEFAQQIVGMANFRNILVHAYLRINREIVYDYLERLGDFEEFIRQVEVYLDPNYKNRSTP